MKNLHTFEEFVNENVVNENLVGDMKFPEKVFIDWMKEYLEENSGIKGFGAHNSYVKAGIKSPPKTIDEFLEWWKGFDKTFPKGSGWGDVPDIVIAVSQMWAESGRLSQNTLVHKIAPYLEDNFKK